MLTLVSPYLHFYPLEDVSRYRDPQLQVGGNDSYVSDLKGKNSNLYV